MSPTPGRSTLITSAPNHASSCVQVGPDWTWVKSRMRTPLSAFVICPLLLRSVFRHAREGGHPVFAVESVGLSVRLKIGQRLLDSPLARGMTPMAYQFTSFSERSAD